ncbi:ABC transporter permease [uncultured Acetatifactor sp.]|uniref:ABC transporter permease n=1 Tax=uncultured Acetatifactor sp. TaxID=1671927 RepID=UPI0026018CF0|nr:ABC transporter permease [uncultured Acetatifactor sp.]
MNSGNVLKRCCHRSLRENRKRTAVTIIGVVLATALITGVACIAVSFRASLVAYEKEQYGDFHYCFLDVGQEYLKYFENNRYIKEYSLAETIGYARLEGSQNADKPYLYISAIEEGMEGTLALKLAAGRMPESDTELVVGRHVISNGQADVKIGDVLTLEIGDRVSEDIPLRQETPYLGEEERLEVSLEKTYTVVGILERPNHELEPWIAPGYSAFTLLENPAEAEKANVYVSYTEEGLHQYEAVTAGILGVEEDLYHRYYNGEVYTQEEQRQICTVARSVQENNRVVKWELMIFSDRMMNMMYAMATIAILIIMVTSVFCIHNSFLISLTEKMKLYGRLASVGTTAGQQRKIVYYEARVLGGIGIPLGVGCGVAATAILLKAVGGLVKDALGFQLVFQVSFPAILLGAVISAVTVYFSASGSARRAARISPISAIRGNDTILIKEISKGLRCPAWVNRFFGIGGKIAYKNLKRARVKYRTTVVSIVVSVAVFIGMSTFVELMLYASSYYYEDMPCQIRASIYQWKFYEEALKMARMDGVLEAEVVRSARFPVDRTQIGYAEEYLKEYDVSEQPAIILRSLGEDAYARYCSKLGVSVEEAKDKGIVLADYSWENWVDGKLHKREGKIARFQPGQILQGTETAAGLDIEVLLQTDIKPMYLSDSTANQITVIVSDEWMDTRPAPVTRYDNVEVYIRCEDSDKIEEAIRNDMQLQHFTVTNFDAMYRSDRSMRLVVAIFLYGFILVVALIGITNIFNTITTNMELRAPEFAMLKSIGMTRKEFRRMIWLEGMFYGGKALLIGIPLGIMLSACFNRALGEGLVTAFRFPWLGTVTAVAAVILLLYVIMRYSMGKINRKNIIETIQNENI